MQSPLLIDPSTNTMVPIANFISVIKPWRADIDDEGEKCSYLSFVEAIPGQRLYG